MQLGTASAGLSAYELVEPCGCTSHPANYLGGANGVSLDACGNLCFADPTCVIFNWAPSNGNCHRYSQDCVCAVNLYQDKYKVTTRNCGAPSGRVSKIKYNWICGNDAL